MNLAELAKRAKALPDCTAFNWPGPEHYHAMVFDAATATPEKLRVYVRQLHDRMGEYSLALSELGDAYRQLRDLILLFEVERS